MKKLVFVLALGLLATFAFSQIGTDIFVGYEWGLGLKGTDAGSSTVIDPSASVTSAPLMDVGFLVDYEVADGFSIDGGIGGAMPLVQLPVLQKDGTYKPLGFMLDGLVGLSYSYPLEPVVLKVNIMGGVSFLDFSSFGFLIKAKFGIGYDIGGFTISVGAGYEMRQYTISLESGENGTLSFSSIPIELGITLKF